jgi:hypothetical protein
MLVALSIKLKQIPVSLVKEDILAVDPYLRTCTDKGKCKECESGNISGVVSMLQVGQLPTSNCYSFSQTPNRES